MAPKALTDCPENLREAIDWLIQVKHSGGILTLSEALGELFDNVVQDAEKSLSSLPESDQPSARDVISGLTAFKNAITKNSENPNQDTLHNLCSAFETFLGYKPPGTYDGSGIVYGSASRLCDAIIQFLHSVFSDVRDNQPYVVGRPELSSVVGELEKTRWSGHHGFKHVVPKVASGLRKYNEDVKASNERVKQLISELLDHVNPGGELLKRVNGLQVDNVTEEEVKNAEGLVEECQKRADAFYNNMNTVASTTSAIKDLNPTLRDKVMTAKKHMAQERKRLQNLTRKQLENYNAMVKVIRKALRELEDSVSKKIIDEIDALVEKLKRVVEKIRAKLVDTYLELGKYVDELEAWITEAKKFIAFADQNVKEILDEVDAEKGEKRKEIEENVNKINNGLDKETKDLQTWINNAEETRGKAERRAKEAFKILSYYKNYKSREKTELAENIQKILDAKEQIVKINTELTINIGDLENWKNAADGLISVVISNSKDVRGKLSPEKNSGHDVGKQIGEIVTANKKIDQANQNLATHLGSLNEWKQQAKTVLQGAIQKATEVWTALDVDDTGKDMQLGKNIEAIISANDLIKRANNDLNTEVQHLGKWRDAAKDVINKANKKCDDVLNKVDVSKNSGNDVVIQKQAAALQKKAAELLKAYEEAHKAVQALASKHVPAAIKDLESGMKEDLERLQQRIVQSMKTHVGLMLGEIQGEVKKIKGEKGSGDKNTGGAGLEGIVTGLVGSYASVFKDNFESIVNGWLLKILGMDEHQENTKVKEWLNQYAREKTSKGFTIASFRNTIIRKIKEKLRDEEIKGAGDIVQHHIAKASDKIEATVEAVKNGCDEFVRQLDDKFQQGLINLATEILRGTPYSHTGQPVYFVTELALIALRATANQVANELESVFLGTYRMGGESGGKCIASEFDRAVQATRDLEKNLQAAHDKAITQGSAPASPPSPGTNEILKKVNEIEQQVKGVIPDKKEMEKRFSTDVMTSYNKAKTPGQGNKYNELVAAIPLAMNKFKSMDAFKDVSEFEGHTGLQKELQKGTVGTATQAVNKHLSAIEQELQDIAGMVDSSKKKTQPPSKPDEYGITQLLNDLKTKGLENGDTEWTPISGGTPVQGLEKIREAIETLQLVEFTNQPIEIKAAVQEIKDHLKKLRDDLKATSGNKYDVINRLNHIINEGLGTTEISWNGRNGLMKIHEEIETLQLVDFTNHPIGIQDAVDVITQELQKLRSDLDNNVTNKLQKLQRFGLENGGYDWDGQNRNVKGFDTIKEYVKEQNEELGKQPNAIEKAVENIRVELAKIGIKLHNVMLDGDVVDHLRTLRTLISKHDKRHGLQAIHKALNDVHTLVPVVGIGLTELCEAVKLPGLSVKETVERLSTLIDHDYVVINGCEQHGLNEIKNKLKRLRADLLSGPIEACEQFLRDADETGRLAKQKIREHLREQISIAEDAMIVQANANYVSSVKQMLQQYASKVNSELGKLPDEIDHDLAIGFKGFVKQIAGDNNGNINLLRDAASLRDLSYRFNVFCGRLRMYLEAEIKREHDENMSQRNPVARDPETLYTNKLAEIYTALNDLLGHLIRQNRYDPEMPGKLDKLIDAVNALRPQGFTKPNSPLLDGIGEGLRAFVEELRNVYISTYDGAFDDCILYHAAKKTHTPEATKCAMILLTITDTLFRAVNKLRMGCTDEWAYYNINVGCGLGVFLQGCGYRVASATVKHSELRNDSDCSGEKIRKLIDNIIEPLGALHDFLKCYLRASHLHIPTEPRYPCTVRDMLAWFAGLPYTAVYKSIQPHCHNLSGGETDEVLKYCLACIPGALGLLTHHSSTLLVTVCGNGRGFDHADFQYACNFWDNTRGFHYPSDVAELLNILARLCKRALRALNFLRARCRYEASMAHGWSQCRYGRSVPAANWQCNDHSTDQATCQPKSPLQAHLMDQLLGLLPHKLTSVGCDSECSTCHTASPGQQCVTPMGFWDLPRAGSRTGVGRDIFAVLTALCSNAESPLPSLLRCLSSINPCPPQSLGDMFAFFCNLAQCRGLDHRTQRLKYVDNSGFTAHLTSAAIPSVSMNLCPSTQAVRLTSALTALYHSPADHATAAQADTDTDKNTNTDTHSDLSSLTVRAHCSDSLTCAPYLQPLSFHACHTFAEKHAEVYLSWVIYTAWQFWYLLQQLLNAFQDIDCAGSGCSTCPCKPGKHGVDRNCKCKALMSCHGVLPTFHAYGFTFGNTRALHGNNRKYCRNFRTQLSQVLHSDHFTELFKQIDQLLYRIRAPFLFTIITLWLIATIYILHSLLYRMDVLHIRSHLLTTKTSHLIDIKALLAGSRRMLSLYKDVDYFDDDSVGQLGVSRGDYLCRCSVPTTIMLHEITKLA
ncbi:Extracellular matrix-binding ebh, putative [Babesia ovata]|uniref:Extracellular matrix-binding ebh, putative n=1 Tax=Babesia ovata TaxID=189622 RepID=A0A2H6K830_9APIC|nr:Extracellular matrix-binding ebh, putative [Babesia ovata]GBE59151.1 Extracellular matrix-binding ebh, putative [Babesia ovata]